MYVLTLFGFETTVVFFGNWFPLSLLISHKTTQIKNYPQIQHTTNNNNNNNVVQKEGTTNPTQTKRMAEDIIDNVDVVSEESLAFITAEQQLTISNVMGLVGLMYGLIVVLAPHKQVELYSAGKDQERKHGKELLLTKGDEKSLTDKNRKVVEYNFQYQNLCVLEVGLIMMLMNVSSNLPFIEASCIASIPWLLFALWALLNDIPKKLGRSNKASYTLLLLNIPRFVAGVLLNSNDEDDENIVTTARSFAIQMNIVFALVNGFLFLSVPVSGPTLYGLPSKEHDKITLARCAFGVNLFSLGVLGASIAWFDTTRVMALGFAYASWFLGILWLVSDMKRLGINLQPVYIWLCISIAIALILTYQVPEGETNEAEDEDKDQVVGPSPSMFDWEW